MQQAEKIINYKVSNKKKNINNKINKTWFCQQDFIINLKMKGNKMVVIEKLKSMA